MAYFSNSSEGEVLGEECAECIFGQEQCPVFWVQSFYNYEACNNKTAREILNNLVKQKDNYEYVGCQMKPLLDKLKKRLRSDDCEGQRLMFGREIGE